MGDVTVLLTRWNNGDAEALKELLGVVHDELRQLAGKLLRHERTDHTLQPTELVHEVYLRLEGLQEMPFDGRRHFYGAAAQAMRRILVDHARRHGAARRGGGARRITLDTVDALAVDERAELLVDLDEALERLAALDERQARVVECRFFGGLTEEETAEALGISPRTAKRDWAKARSWLYQELHPEAV
jgi:RNA polymerase sigma factor (TIGR02999 family)